MVQSRNIDMRGGWKVLGPIKKHWSERRLKSYWSNQETLIWEEAEKFLAQSTLIWKKAEKLLAQLRNINKRGDWKILGLIKKYGEMKSTWYSIYSSECFTHDKFTHCSSSFLNLSKINSIKKKRWFLFCFGWRLFIVPKDVSMCKYTHIKVRIGVCIYSTTLLQAGCDAKLIFK